jgi:hypothetical protein
MYLTAYFKRFTASKQTFGPFVISGNIAGGTLVIRAGMIIPRKILRPDV